MNWSFKSEYNGGPLTMSYSGEVAKADKFSGSVHVEEYGVDGEFTATATK